MYVVGTPIGNLEDVSLRALRVLSEVGMIAAEDTRITRRLLARHAIPTPTTSFHEHTDARRRARLVALLDEMDLALVTDAGTPGVSDPGAALVADAREAGHDVVVVPGPSAITAALAVSGLPGDGFVFVGFLPRRSKDRRSALGALAAEERTLVAFEAPHRLRASLVDLHDVLGPERTIVVARELTKLHEEVWRGSLGDAVVHWSDRAPRGEFVLVIEAGAHGRPAEVPSAWTDADVLEAVAALRSTGVGAKEAARTVAAESGRTTREVYALWHGRGEGASARGRTAGEAGPLNQQGERE